MQAPHGFHKTTYPIPSHKPRHTRSSSSLRPSSSIPRILAGAAAVTASRSWVLSNDESTGGVVLLVMALWGGRVLTEVWELRRDRKGKKKESGGVDWNLAQVTSIGALASQSIAFFMSIKSIGPLRGSILTILTSILGPYLHLDSKTGNREKYPLLPAILAAGLVLFDAHKEHGAQCLTTLITLMALSIWICGPLSPYLESKSRSTLSRTGSAHLDRLLVGALATSLMLSACLYTDLLPSLHHLLDIPYHHLILPIITACLVRYTPLPFASTPDPKPATRLRTPKDYTIYLFAIVALQFLALHPIPSLTDIFILLPLVLLTIYTSHSPPIATPGRARLEPVRQPSFIVSTAKSGNWKNFSLMKLLPLSWRPHFQTILHTESSRRIFYFLCINLAYMGVQLGYGVLTNSLGLISDAIHMFFDCLGLGVGLWASVAATWKPDNRYTFGYTRVETLSGFANGCFLILISIMIVFEGIQRILDPPEMEVRQLLLVSSIGLAINLFGMWATGGHHHHGHGHSHGHSDDHGHSHHHVHDKKEDHSHSSPNKENGFHQHREDHDHHCEHRHDDHSHSQHSHHSHDSHDHHDHSHDHHTNHHDGHDDHSHRGHEHTNGSNHLHHHEHHEHTDSGSDHSHSHSHSHSHAHSHNMRGVFLHVMADTLGSVGVIISTILIQITGWTVFDPIASLFIAMMIMVSVIPLVIDSAKVLCLDVGPDIEKDIRTALAELVGVEGLASFSAPRFWPRCEGEIVGSIHIQLAPSLSTVDPTRFSTPHINRGPTIYANSSKISKKVERILKSGIPGLTELIIQIEGSEEKVYCDCMTGGG